MMNRASLLVAGVILAGCATMSPEECLQANWEEIGYNDAIEGRSVSRSQAHREACAETGVNVDFELYRHGYALGLPYYCTRETGFESGDHGGEYAAQCVSENFPDYASGYSEGLDVFALKRELRELEERIDDKSAQANALLSQIRQLRITRDNDQLPSDTRREARYQLTQLESLYGTLYREIESLNQERDQLAAEIGELTAAFYRSL
ncbi:MAG: DUF2799 domain-containing protein [Luminiphilus sp.]|nr:DUF2799 domain-containing protein [Luminiphilus sp.]